MALKPFFDDPSEIPQGMEDLYVEHDGRHVLDVAPDNGWALEDVSGLKSALSKERASAQTLAKRVETFGDLDPGKAKEAMERLKELEQIDPTKEADKIATTKFEGLKTQLLEKHKGEVAKMADENTRLRGSLEKILVDQAATQALAEAGGSVRLLLPHIRSSTRVVQSDKGDFMVEVVGADGNARIGSKNGDAMTLKELVEEMRDSDDFGAAFKASGMSGSGKSASSSAAPQMAVSGNIGGSRDERAAHFAKKYKLPRA